MATMASTLLRAARNASLASRAAAAAATRAAAMASRSARAAGVAAAAARAGAGAARLDAGVKFPLKNCPTRDDGSTKLPDDALCRTSSSSCADYTHLSGSSENSHSGAGTDQGRAGGANDAGLRTSDDDGITPVDKDMESDEDIWALYERWCKAFNKKRDQAEMAHRFKLFKHYAQHVYNWNTYVPSDPKEAAIYRRKRRQVELLLSKDKDISHIEYKYLPLELYLNADGSDPFLSEYDKNLLKQIEEREAHGAVKDAA